MTGEPEPLVYGTLMAGFAQACNADDGDRLRAFFQRCGNREHFVFTPEEAAAPAAQTPK